MSMSVDNKTIGMQILIKGTIHQDIEGQLSWSFEKYGLESILLWAPKGIYGYCVSYMCHDMTRVFLPIPASQGHSNWCSLGNYWVKDGNDYKVIITWEECDSINLHFLVWQFIETLCGCQKLSSEMSK